MIKNKGFTIIELIVVIAITAVLSGIILFSVTQYINRGKDSNISGNLVVLITAGEVYYNADNTYSGFCGSDVVTNAENQMPQNTSEVCPTNNAGVCCFVYTSSDNYNGKSWAACAREFVNPNMAYCVDSRGMKEEIANSCCISTLSQCPDFTLQPQCQ